MFERKMPLFTLFGFKVRIDITWFVLVVLITRSLAKGALPHYFAGFSDTTYGWMGATGTLGLFMSILFYEFCHSLATNSTFPWKGQYHSGLIDSWLTMVRICKYQGQPERCEYYLAKSTETASLSRNVITMARVNEQVNQIHKEDLVAAATSAQEEGFGEEKRKAK